MPKTAAKETTFKMRAWHTNLLRQAAQRTLKVIPIGPHSRCAGALLDAA